LEGGPQRRQRQAQQLRRGGGAAGRGVVAGGQQRLLPQDGARPKDPPAHPPPAPLTHDAHPARAAEGGPGAGRVLLEERKAGEAVDLLPGGEPVVELPGREEPEQGVAAQELASHPDALSIPGSKVASCIRPASQPPNNSSSIRRRVAGFSSAGNRSST